ncbi:MAG: hypothetical protein NT074_08420 [Methanomicrobiales archaeon]|jgi:hypothetical protein|nr:hypothetical protein [Methanomicrobiales archaeon]
MNDYVHAMEHLYEKSLILHDTSQFHPVLSFYFFDALAHIDYTLGLLSYNYQSVKNIMAGEYLRWRIDQERSGDRPRFPGFIAWLKIKDSERFSRLPSLWRRVYDPQDPAGYRSFRIVLDPDAHESITPTQFYRWTEEFFQGEFLKSLYQDASLAGLFTEYLNTGITKGPL